MADETRQPKFRRGIHRPTIQADPVEQLKPAVDPPSGPRRLIAGGLRVGSQVLAGIPAAAPGLGSLAAAGIGGAGELAAQAVEEGPSTIFDKESMTRAGVEAGLAAIPGKALLTPGRVGQSIVKSGIGGMIGEGAREVARGEEISPSSVLGVGAMSAATGGLLGKFLPKTAHELQKTEMHGPQTLDEWVKSQKMDVPAIAKKAAEWQKDGMPEAAQDLRVAGLRILETDPKVSAKIRLAARRHEIDGDDEAAQGLRIGALDAGIQDLKIAEDAASAASRIKTQKTALDTRKKMLQGGAKTKTTLSQTAKGVDPETGKTVTATEKLVKPRKRGGAEPVEGVHGDIPPPGTPARQMYDGWLSKGLDHDKALELAAKGVQPRNLPTLPPPATPEAPIQATAATPEAPIQAKPIDASPIVPMSDAAKGVRNITDTPVAPMASEAGDLAQGAGTKMAAEAPEALARNVDPAAAALTPTREAELAAKFGGTKAVPEPVRDRRVAEQLAKVGGRRAGDPPAAPVTPETPPAPPPVTTPALAQAPEAPLPTTKKPVVTANDKILKSLGYGPGVVRSLSPERISQIVRGQVAAPAISTDERIAIIDNVVRDAYKEVPEVGDRIANLSRLYNQAKAANDPNAGVLGAALQAESRAAEEQGLVAAGFGKAVSQEIKDAIDDITLQKINQSEGDLIDGVMPPSVLNPSEVGALPTLARTPLIPEAPAAPQTSRVGEMTPEMAQKMQSLRDRANAGEDVAAEADLLQKELLGGQSPTTPPTEGGFTAGSLFGGAQGIGGIIERNPLLASRLAMGAAGALGGAAIDPLDDPFSSMVLGGAAGFSVPTLIKGLKAIGADLNDPLIKKGVNDPDGIKGFASTAFHLLPHLQRFNYLASSGLPANAFVGPYGSAFFGAMTKALAGDPKGWAAMKELTPGNWARLYKESWDEAKGLISRVEAGDPLARAEIHGPGLAALPAAASHTIQMPAYMMAAGDLASRKALLKAGFSEQEAREVTLTAEPFLPMMRKLANLRRGKRSPGMEILFPFVRTPANVFEQGLSRMPGVGFAVQGMREAHGAAAMPMAEQAAQQAVGFMVGSAAYIIGTQMSPETAKTYRRYVTNAAGPYSMLAAIGFAAGQANQRSGMSFPEALGSPEVLREAEYSLPLPSTGPITDVYNYLRGSRTTAPGLAGEIQNTINPQPTPSQVGRIKSSIPGQPKFSRRRAQQ